MSGEHREERVTNLEDVFLSGTFGTAEAPPAPIVGAPVRTPVASATPWMRRTGVTTMGATMALLLALGLSGTPGGHPAPHLTTGSPGPSLGTPNFRLHPPPGTGIGTTTNTDTSSPTVPVPHAPSPNAAPAQASLLTSQTSLGTPPGPAPSVTLLKFVTPTTQTGSGPAPPRAPPPVTTPPPPPSTPPHPTPPPKPSPPPPPPHPTPPPSPPLDHGGGNNADHGVLAMALVADQHGTQHGCDQSGPTPRVRSNAPRQLACVPGGQGSDGAATTNGDGPS
ncbi:MAG TPA: hypothetical protein VNG12_15670 [Acidimicrobiales bacterium]|nr:hypothetical protein [Acidimicrobiales bacterium]